MNFQSTMTIIRLCIKLLKSVCVYFENSYKVTLHILKVLLDFNKLITLHKHAKLSLFLSSPDKWLLLPSSFIQLLYIA